MRPNRLSWICALALSLGFLGAGCERGPAPLNTVSGRVSYQGFGLNGGTIVFVPDASRGEHGPIAFGTIHGDGTYSLNTGDAAGATAGWYRVTVTSLAPSSSQSSQSFNFPQSTIPEKYRDPELSRLACEVKAHQANTINFDLN